MACGMGPLVGPPTLEGYVATGGPGPNKDVGGRIKSEPSVKTNAIIVIDFFLFTMHYPFEVALAFAGVWGAESGINPARCNTDERDYGGMAPESTDKYFMWPQSGSDRKKYYMDKANMKVWGYGKGVAQWTWSRVFKFRDWYNGGADGRKTPGIDRIDENGAYILKTNMETQSAFAQYEISRGRKAFVAFTEAMRSTHVKASENPKQFNENVIRSCDAVLRGYENGATSFTSVEDIDTRHKKHGGYQHIMDHRVGWALGLFEQLKGESKYQPYV